MSELILPHAGCARVGGIFTITHLRNGQILDEFGCPNIVVDEGLNYLLNVGFHGDPADASWFIGLFEGNYTPIATDNGANIVANSVECTTYSQTARPAWSPAAAIGKSISNSATPATFTLSANKTVYGAFLISTSTKSDTIGTLAAAVRFPTARNLLTNDELLINYTLSASSA